MRAVAEFVMRGRTQAISVAAIAAFLPLMQWLSNAVVGLVVLLIEKISGSISWQFFSTGVIVVIVISVVLGIGQFLSLQIAVLWAKLRRNVVSKWPESPFKHWVETNIESDINKCKNLC